MLCNRYYINLNNNVTNRFNNKSQVRFEDFEKAMSKIIPTTERNVVLNPKKLPSIYRPLYEKTLQDVISYISKIFPELNSQSNQR